MLNAGMYTSTTAEWATPQEFFDRLNSEFAFLLDVCATPRNAKCAQFFSDRGLSQDWTGVCWMNPPYGRHITAWVRKAWQSAQAGCTVVCLLPSRTDTDWWHRYVMNASEIRFVRGRLQFGNGHDAPFPCAVVVFRPGAGRILVGAMAA